jgi:hypothetical protein
VRLLVSTHEHQHVDGRQKWIHVSASVPCTAYHHLELDVILICDVLRPYVLGSCQPVLQSTASGGQHASLTVQCTHITYKLIGFRAKLIME